MYIYIYIYMLYAYIHIMYIHSMFYSQYMYHHISGVLTICGTEASPGHQVFQEAPGHHSLWSWRKHCPPSHEFVLFYPMKYRYLL